MPSDTDAREDDDPGDGRDTVLYMVEVACPNCEENVRFVEERDEPTNLMQDVAITSEHCPECGLHEPTFGQEWDYQAEYEIKRVKPTQEREGHQR